MQAQTLILLVAVLLAIAFSLPSAIGDSESDRLKYVETLKMLQNLDKYYGQVARPRFGKRDFPARLQDRLEEVMNEETVEGRQPWEQYAR